MIRDVMKRLELPEGQFKVGQVLGRISDAKNALVGPEEVTRLAVNPPAKHIAGVLHALPGGAAQERRVRLRRPDRESRCGCSASDRRSAGATAQRFRHVLVDEYQDTNHAQFRLVEARWRRRTATCSRSGDDDQAIYGWRGADLSNVLDFEQSFPGASRGAARAELPLDRQHPRRRQRGDREQPGAQGQDAVVRARGRARALRFVLAEDEVDEARRVRAIPRASTCGAAAGSPIARCSTAPTRSRGRSRPSCARSRVPYEIVGGVSFYQRREVKDLLAYLRLVVNPTDAVAFWRIWNTPRRGLGAAVRATVEERMARGRAGSARRRCGALVDERRADARRAHAGAADFIAVLDELRAAARGCRSIACSSGCCERTELPRVAGRASEDAADRRANVEELRVRGAPTFAGHADRRSLADFLAEAALVTDVDQLERHGDRVLLLTAAQRQGARVPAGDRRRARGGAAAARVVARGRPAELEEERRLFYVALTRAQDDVLLTAAAFRRPLRRRARRRGVALRRGDPRRAARARGTPARSRVASGGSDWDDADGGSGIASLGGRRRVARPSRSRVSTGAGRTARATAHRAVGREVYHESFGRGVVVAAEGEGDDVKFTVRFGTRIKKVLGRFLTGGPDGD